MTSRRPAWRLWRAVAIGRAAACSWPASRRSSSARSRRPTCPSDPLQLATRPAHRPGARPARAACDLGYEPVPEVGGRGEFARRGGIVDVFPAGQPLPVRIEWFGDEVESLRAFDPADQRGVGADRRDRAPAGQRVPAAGRRAARRGCAPAWAGRRAPARATSPTDLARLVTGRPRRRGRGLGRRPRAGDGARPHRRRDLGARRAGRHRTPRPTSCGRRPTSGRGAGQRAGELCRALGRGAIPEPRAWKRRLHEARTLELTWESEIDGAPPGGNPFGWHEPIAAAGSRSATWARPSRAGGARASGSCWPRDQSARLSEMLADVGHHAPRRWSACRERRRRAAWRSIDRSLNWRLRRRPGGARPGHRPRAVRHGPRPPAAGPAPRRAARPARAPPAGRRGRPHRPRRGALRRPDPARSAGGDGDEERDFLELHFAGHRPDLGPGRADRARHPLRRRRPAAPEPPWWRRVAAHQVARPRGGHRPGQGAAGALRRPRQRAAATPSARTRRGSRRWRPPSPTRRRPTSCAPSPRSRPTWSAEQPMDRLVCGDVGYGKTEVALRAAFKAVQDGRQVAVLVPTTVLAQQHLDDLPRSASRPTRSASEMLSRFVPPAEQQRDAVARLDGRARSTSSSARTACCQGHPLPATWASSSSTRSSASASPTRSGSSSCARRSTC